MGGFITAAGWRQYLEWTERYFLFPKSKATLSPSVAFRFAEMSKTLIVRNKSHAMYTGASIRALLIRIIDSGEFDHSQAVLSTELGLGTCDLELWDDEMLDRRCPNWYLDTTQIKCSSKWYSQVLGWSDLLIKERFGLASVSDLGLVVTSPR